MSHFVGYVLCNDSDDVERLVAPYNEQDESYFEFDPQFNSEKEAREAYKEWRKDSEYTEYVHKYTFETWIKDWHEYHEENGKYGYRCNPNAKWDWYQEGGRFSNYMSNMIKDGAKPDFDGNYFIRDLKFQNEEEKKNAEEYWHKYVELHDLSVEEYPLALKPEALVKTYKTKEFYSLYKSYHTPYCFVTPDGVWHECGSMGWWGIDSKSYESISKYLNEWIEAIEKYKDCKCVLIDFHI